MSKHNKSDGIAFAHYAEQIIVAHVDFRDTPFIGKLVNESAFFITLQVKSGGLVDVAKRMVKVVYPARNQPQQTPSEAV